MRSSYKDEFITLHRIGEGNFTYVDLVLSRSTNRPFAMKRSKTALHKPADRLNFIFSFHLDGVSFGKFKCFLKFVVVLISSNTIKVGKRMVRAFTEYHVGCTFTLLECCARGSLQVAIEQSLNVGFSP